MKRNLLTLAAVGAIALGGFVIAQADTGHRFGGRWQDGEQGHGFALQHLTRGLDLSSDQQAKVQPIIDQAKPKIVAIHMDAMQKAKAVIDDAMTQIRPLLTPAQQKKFDAIQKAHQDLQKARQELRDAMKE